jgi:hypothetical protein
VDHVGCTCDDSPRDARAVSRQLACVRIDELHEEVGRDPGAAIAAVDAALQPWLGGRSFAEVVTAVELGRPIEGQLAVWERGRDQTLVELVGLRWNATRARERAGHVERPSAAAIRRFALLGWPRRASTWVVAGNQHLDEGDVDAAHRCFTEALRRGPDHVGATAGRAIVAEQRKDWAAALDDRRRVVELTRADELDDDASLHRSVRLAAACARAGARDEAAQRARDTCARGAFERLPAERVALLRLLTFVGPSPATLLALSEGPALTPILDHVDPATASEVRHLTTWAKTVLGTRSRSLPVDDVDRALHDGLAAWLTNDPHAALDALERYDEAERDDPLALVALASLYAETGRGDHARSAVDLLARVLLERDERDENGALEEDTRACAHVFAQLPSAAEVFATLDETERQQLRDMAHARVTPAITTPLRSLAARSVGWRVRGRRPPS